MEYKYQPVPVEQLADYLKTSEGHEYTCIPLTLIRNAVAELYAVKKGQAFDESEPGEQVQRVWRIGNPENDQHCFTDKQETAEKAEKNGYEVTAYVQGLFRGRTAMGWWREALVYSQSLRGSRRAQPAGVVPTFDQWLESSGQKPLGWVKEAMREAYDACRAAALTGETS